MSDQQEQAVSQADEDTKGKIKYILRVYPYVSRSMLQVALGPALSPVYWAPALEELVEAKEVLCIDVETIDHKGRAQGKTVYHLPEYPYPPSVVQPNGNPNEAETSTQAA